VYLLESKHEIEKTRDVMLRLWGECIWQGAMDVLGTDKKLMGEKKGGTAYERLSIYQSVKGTACEHHRA
jgi:hypothetical protein